MYVLNVVLLLALLLWFAVVAIGLTVKGIVIAERDFDLITIVWLVLFAGCVVSFFVIPSVGQFVTVGFQFVWIAMQSLNFIRPTPERAAGYNRTFKNTHHIIPASEKYVIPDTAHLILFTLLALSFVAMLLNIIMG